MISPKSWRVESVLLLILRLALCIAVGGLLASLARAAIGPKLLQDSLLHLFIAALTMQVAGLVLVGIFLREHQIGWAEAFGFTRNWRRAAFIGLGVGALVLPAVWGLQMLSGAALRAAGFDVSEQEAVRLLRGTHTFGQQLFLGVVAIIIAPPVEEMFFRGILYPLIKQAGFPRWALWGVAALFAFVHGNLPILVPLFGLAVVLALLYEWTDNLLACITVHAVFNAANFVMMFFLPESGRLPGSP